MQAQPLDSPDVTPAPPDIVPLGGVMQVVGLSYRMLDYWSRRGYLRPEKAAPGTGYPRTWPEPEVAIARAMVRLVGCGFTVGAAARLARDEAISERLTVLLCDGVSLRLHPDVWSPGTEHPATLADDVTTVWSKP